MARMVRGPRPGDEREFIPTAFENKKDPDPLKVWIKDPSEGEKRELISLQATLQDGTPALEMDFQTMMRWQCEVVQRHVSKVYGYTVRGIEITDGQLLADHGETELIAEISLEVFSAASLSDDEKKSSSEPSDSMPEVVSLDGIACNAKSEATTFDATVTDRVAISYS